MMKRFTCLMAVLVVLAASAIFPAQASETSENIIYFEDGSYLVTTITEIPSRAVSTKTGSKSGRLYNQNDELELMITITGTFSYSGTSSQCTYVDGSISIVKSNKYSLDSESSTKSGNTATYTVVLNQKTLGIIFGKETHSISLTCDKNGNLS